MWLLGWLKSSNSKVTIPAAVYEEVGRLKNDRDREKSTKARIAFKRIKLFTDNDALDIPGLQKVADRKAYADKDLISLVKKWSELDQEVYLFTDDQDLIVRAKNILSKKELCHFVSVKPTEFSDSPEAKDFIQYFKERLQNLANEQSEK
jgi:rRNA-processing protein FCF1